MNDVLRRAWMLLLISGLIILPACSSDSGESGQVAEMEEAVQAPSSGDAAGAGAGETTGDAPPAGQQEEEFSRLQQEETLAKQRADLLVQTYLNSARRYVHNSELGKAERAILSALQARPSDQGAID